MPELSDLLAENKEGIINSWAYFVVGNVPYYRENFDNDASAEFFNQLTTNIDTLLTGIINVIANKENTRILNGFLPGLAESRSAEKCPVYQTQRAILYGVDVMIPLLNKEYSKDELPSKINELRNLFTDVVLRYSKDSERIAEESRAEILRSRERLKESFFATMRALNSAIEDRDTETKGHSDNVAFYSKLIAEKIGLPEERVEEVKIAAELHDLGKIQYSDEIIKGDGKLTPEQREQVKDHPAIASQIILETQIDYAADIANAVHNHHVRYDGEIKDVYEKKFYGGYPKTGLRGEDIPIGARIIAVADAYDAMRSQRRFRKRALTAEEARAELIRESGGQFDPFLVEVFLEILDENNNFNHTYSHVRN